MSLLVKCVVSLAGKSTRRPRRPTTENVILVTLDGLRWQEVFGGADARLMSKESGGVRDEAVLRQEFWADQPQVRREQLMPFFWRVVAKQGSDHR